MRTTARLRDVPILDLRTWGLKSDTWPICAGAACRPCSHARAVASERLFAVGESFGYASRVCEGQAVLVSATRDGQFLARHRTAVPCQHSYVFAVMKSLPSSANVTLPLDSTEFVDTLRQTLNQQGLLSSVRARAVASGTTDLLRLVIPSESQAIKVGDVTAVGLYLSHVQLRPLGIARPWSALAPQVYQWPQDCRRHRTILVPSRGRDPALTRWITRGHPDCACPRPWSNGPLETSRGRLRNQCRCGD